MGLAIGSSSFAFAAFTLAAHYAGKPPSSLTVVSSRWHMSVWRSVALRCVVRRAVVECCALGCREQCPQGSARLGSVTPRPAIGPRRACNCRARSRSTMSTRHRHLRSFRTAHSSKAAEVPHRTVAVGDSGVARCGVRWSLYLGCRVSRLCSQPSRRFLFSTRWRLFIDPIQECALRYSRSAYGVAT
jgi:hypothetical protein